MENRAYMWKVVGVVAMLAIVASFSFIYSVFKEVSAMTPRDSDMIEEVLKALQTSDSTFAREE